MSIYLYCADLLCVHSYATIATNILISNHSVVWPVLDNAGTKWYLQAVVGKDDDEYPSHVNSSVWFTITPGNL